MLPTFWWNKWKSGVSVRLIEEDHGLSQRIKILFVIVSNFSTKHYLCLTNSLGLSSIYREENESCNKSNNTNKSDCPDEEVARAPPNVLLLLFVF